MITETDNGAKVYSTTKSGIIDFFGIAGAMRHRSTEDKIELFKKAMEDDTELALKCLFYIRDCRGGQGERDTFRDIYKYLSEHHQGLACANIPNIIEYGRIDDIIDILYRSQNPHFQKTVVKFINDCIREDIKNLQKNKPVSLMAKWLPSINTSSHSTVRKAKFLCKCLNMSEKSYRQTLSLLRTHINIVEKNLTNKTYENIKYENVPSKAMTKYRKLFKKVDTDRFNKYIENLKSGNAKINASTLYPYDIVKPYLNRSSFDDILEEQWKKLPDYIDGKQCDILPICDVSGSMYNYGAIYSSVGLTLYISERLSGPFKNLCIPFSERPSFVKIEGKSLYEKVRNLEKMDWGYSTNIELVFDMLLKKCIKAQVPQDGMPKKILIISDMEFNAGASEDEILFESIKKKYQDNGYTLPQLVWWNVDARNNIFPMTLEDNCLFVSGSSPSIMKAILSGNVITAQDVIQETLLSERYSKIIYKI